MTENKEKTEKNNLNILYKITTILFDEKRKSLTAILMAILGVVVITIAFIMRPSKIEVSTGLGTITVKDGNTQSSIFLLNPCGSGENTPWVQTGIKVKKGDKIKIAASGRVHTALKRLVAEVQNHETVDTTSLPWVGPEGLPFSSDSKLQSALDSFNSYKVLPDKNGAHNGYGKLLAGVKNSRQEILPDSIEPIGNSREYQIKEDGELVLTVNDIWLNEKMKDIYILPFDKHFEYYKSEAYFHATLTGETVSNWSKEKEKEKAREEYQKRLRSWDKVVKNKSWNLWYEDNIGSFSVSITVN
jgi:hypothetical protein